MIDLTKYIVHVEAVNQDSYNMGVGFVVNNLFITSGHVVDGAEKVYFKLGAKHYSLVPSDFELVCSNPHHVYDLLDVAVYVLPETLESPLKLTDEVPPPTTKLTNWHYNHIVKKSTRASDNVFLNLNTEIWKLTSIDGIIKTTQDNQYYFQCTMDLPLKQGFSGSPIIKNNFVYGILYGGEGEGNESKECFFLSSKAIIELLCKIGVI